jgi:hypothetical protein
MARLSSNCARCAVRLEGVWSAPLPGGIFTESRDWLVGAHGLLTPGEPRRSRPGEAPLGAAGEGGLLRADEHMSDAHKCFPTSALCAAYTSSSGWARSVFVTVARVRSSRRGRSRSPSLSRRGQRRR